MANICNNQLYVYSEDRTNIETVISYLKENFHTDIEDSGEVIDAYFDSKWVFPEEQMTELYNLISNKDDIYMRCLSYEFGNLYHALWTCDEDGWVEV